MIFDPFALTPTATTASLSLDPPQEYKSIIPQLPPQDYTNTQAGVQAKPDSNKTFEYFLSQAKTPNAPLYEYSFEDEKRYSNPYLQFNPRPLGGKDTEDIYAGFQEGGEQLWNALVKTGATAGSSFISSFSSLGSSIDAIRGGQPFDEDSYLGETQGWLRELENDYPNYYSAWEREHPFQSALPFSGGFTNFWGDKVLKNVGFTVGSLAASLLVDAGINLATQGTAAPATFILAANQIKRAISPLKNAFRNLSKTSALNKVDDLAGIARTGEGINKGLSTLNQAYNLKKAAQFAGTTYFAAQGEAMIEGYQTYWDTRARLYEQTADLNIDKAQEIEDIAQTAANTTTALNLPIIMASNLLQFPTIFGGSSLLKRFESPFLEVVNKEGLTVVNNYTKKQAWVNTMKELVKDFATEGGEEGYQYYVGSSIPDYYVDKFNGDATDSLSRYLGKQLPKTIQDEKFWESVVIGGLAGGLMGGYKPIRQNFFGAKDRADQAVETLKPVLERFNSTVKDYVHFAETVEHQQDDNDVNKFQTAHKALYSTVHDSLKFGIYENFQDSLEDLKNLPVEEYNKLFQTEFNETEKLRHLNGIQRETQKIKSDLTEVNKFFQVNPFDSPYVTKRLSDLFKVDQTQIEPLRAKLFEDFKELTAYNISRLRNTRGRISTIEDELKTMGLDESIVPVLYNLDTKQGVDQYKRLKAIQLSTLEDEVNYYKELESPQPELNLRVKNLKKLLNNLDKFDKDELSDLEKESLQALIFNEEMGKKQMIAEEEFKKKQEELRKQQEIALKTAEELEKQTTKSREKVVELVETISNIVPKEEKVVPDVNKPKQIDTFNKNFANLEVGDNFTIELSTEGGTFTLETKQPYVASKDGIRYHFMPDRVVKHDNGEQVLRYALDNIGVQKVDKTVPSLIESPVEIEPVQPIETKKETITKQQKLKQAVDEKKDKAVKPVKDGIYLIEGDYANAWRYVDENTAVPLKLRLKGNQLEYSGDMTKGFDQSITEGYLLDDQYIEKLEKLEQGVDTTQPLEEPIFGIDVREIYQEGLTTEEITGKDKGLSLADLSKKLKDKQQNQTDNLNKFLKTEPISDSLRQVLEWRVGKGITIDC